MNHLMLSIALFCTTEGALARSSDCPNGFREGYFCENTAAGALLRKNEIHIDHNLQVCETTTIANFGLNAEECERAAQAARLGR